MSVAVLDRARAGSAGALLVAGVLWGTGGLAGFPRTAAAARRPAFAGTLLAAYQSCYFSAVRLTSVSIATMVTIGSVPVFVAVADALLRRHRPAAGTVVSILAALLGLLLTWSPDGSAAGGVPVLGVLCALLSGAGFAALPLIVQRRVAGLDPVRTTALGCLLGGVLLLPVALWLGMALPARAEALAALLYLGAVPTALAYAAYFRGLRDAHPVLAALSALLEPLTAAVLAALLLGDRLGLTGWAGAVLLATAVGVGHRRR
ncbi:DMT family transporter [Amycolatopsis aidingensis]|uniref:DMT family transporter n=1 Tax=Amycolatopsis aidingensis TaxID=2842453 RepID=UPI001C0AE388|nr:EamA family transporter [Amycolatopsis aidingensis]